MAGQEFVDIQVANQHLKSWVREVAGTWDHGTTHQPPLRLFHEYEQAALLPLLEEPFTEAEQTQALPTLFKRLTKPNTGSRSLSTSRHENAF